jgi:murein L,D-transpeptidase YcbB/YkuD
MERCRWINNDLPEEFLLVNIAEYRLYLFRDRTIDYECRVVVGKEFHETPVFTSDIKYVVFNPTWTVPYSIASKEILPKLKKDPNYLQKRNITLLKGKEEIDPSTVDFTQYSQNSFPYTLRQEPGPNNALGLVKFIFPNKHAVYLHDTPSKSYFEKTDRAFSHGCVRVKDPFILAEQLLGDKGYDSEKIAEVIKTKKLKNEYLSKPMPVMIMYWTCYENDKDGMIYFFRDIYGRDKKILTELNRDR